MSTTAWMLRQGGDAFAVMHHFYAMQDPDLSSEAEVAAFLIKTNSKDLDIAYETIDAWLALLLIQKDIDVEEDMNSLIQKAITSLPYRFQYALSTGEIIRIHSDLGNFDSTDTLYDYVEHIESNLDNIQQSIKDSLNQQFCRVRFGGQYNQQGTRELWFRISSTGYNWINDIYIFTADNYKRLGATGITVCRDYESDHGDEEGHPEYFYKASDGSLYMNMPIDEFLSEEHDTRPVFSSQDIKSASKLNSGSTFNECNIHERDVIQSMIWKEKDLLCSTKILADALEGYPTRTQTRLRGACRKIKELFPALTEVEIVDIKPRENRNGKLTASEVTFRTFSDEEELNQLNVSIVLNRGIKDTTADDIVRKFRIEFNDYLEFKGIQM